MVPTQFAVTEFRQSWLCGKLPFFESLLLRDPDLDGRGEYKLGWKRQNRLKINFWSQDEHCQSRLQWGLGSQAGVPL